MGINLKDILTRKDFNKLRCLWTNFIDKRNYSILKSLTDINKETTIIKTQDATFFLKVLVKKYKQPSRYDCFALMLAKQEKCPLLTGDQNLRKAAEQEDIEVEGTLWIVEAMITHQVITVQAARIAYQRMKQKGRRLPWDVAEKRLSELESNQ